MALCNSSGEFYAGSRLLSPLVPVLGLSIDQVNFLTCQLVALGLGFPFRSILSPKTTSPRVRHAVELLLGIAMVLFCFGRQILHLFAHATLGFVLTKYFPNRNLMPTVVFVVAMGYLSVCHIYRMILDYGGFTLDITGPLMISVQKITLVAFAVHDGSQREEKDLNPNQKKQQVKSMPEWLTYFSYIFCFTGVMCGPLPFFNDYIAFIEGTAIKKPEDEKTDSEVHFPTNELLKKLGAVAILGALMMSEPHVTPINRLTEEDFLYNTTWAYRMVYILCSMSMHRPMYYFAWKLGEVVNNASDLGFSGYDDKGEAKWDLLNNVDIYTLEVSNSLKVNIESWNTITTHWLRYTVYERVPASIGTWAVFLISAFWHGFYPGYYIAFLTAALFTTAARLIRRNIRPYFLQSEQHKFCYDCVTFLFTRFANCIMVTPFVMLDIKSSLAAYNAMYWWLHILSLGTVVYFNFIKKPAKREKTEKTN